MGYFDTHLPQILLTDNPYLVPVWTSYVNLPLGRARRGEGLALAGDEGGDGGVSEGRDEPLPLPGQVGRQVPLRHDHLLPDVQAGQGIYQ